MLTLGIGIGDVITVPLLELNHVYDRRGDHTFSQLILWREIEGGWHNVGWTFVKHWSEYPTKHGDVWRVRIGKRVVIARHYRVSHTNEDPERVDSSKFWGGGGPNEFTQEMRRVASDE
jgi:hypothetical protein